MAIWLDLGFYPVWEQNFINFPNKTCLGVIISLLAENGDEVRCRMQTSFSFFCYVMSELLSYLVNRDIVTALMVPAKTIWPPRVTETETGCHDKQSSTEALSLLADLPVS